MSTPIDDTRHCWFCGHTTKGRYTKPQEWLCWECGTVEDLDEWPSRDDAAFRAQIEKSLADPEYLDKLAAHLTSPNWQEPLAHPKPLTELHAADIHDGYYAADEDGAQ